MLHRVGPFRVPAFLVFWVFTFDDIYPIHRVIPAKAGISSH